MSFWKKIAYMQLHRICDQECIFCAQPSNWNYMNFDEIRKQIDSYVLKWYEWVIFSWWEPSISPFFFETLEYSQKNNLDMSILTNWHMFENEDFAKKSIEYWLKKYHISLHSHIKKIHDKIVLKEWWYIRSLKAMNNILKYWWNLTVNITINSKNVKFFDKTILFFIKLFPRLDWFIINNLETSQIKSKYYSIIAKLKDIDKVIKKSLQIILDNNKNIRIERVPMCYLRWYEHLSTDIEFTVLNEKKYLHYLDWNTKSWELNKNTCSADYTYWKNCKKCDLNKICSWIEWLWVHFNEEELFTQNLSKVEYNNILSNIWKTI